MRFRPSGIGSTIGSVSDQQEVLLDVADKLDAAGVRYMISGSVALSYYAEPRMTRDIDIVVELSPASAVSLANTLAATYHVDADAVATAARLRGMFNAIHLQHVVKVDFIVRKEAEYRKLEFSRRRRIDWEGRSLPVVAPEDLLLSKLVWARDSRSELQLRDARNLLDSVEDLDLDYARSWAARLGVADLLRELEA